MIHSARAHAKLSASGADRWTSCPGSVHLSEGIPNQDSVWSREGTLAHELLEKLLRSALTKETVVVGTCYPNEMIQHVTRVAQFILQHHRKTQASELLIESKTCLDFISPDMWGTYDSAIVELFGTLHVLDFKYGAGHVVSPRENLQAIFYGLGLAHQFDWNFKRVRLWIIQPRVQGYDGPAFWELSISELRGYVEFFREAVRRVKEEPETYKEGRWCYFCRAKGVCPLKMKNKLEGGQKVFSPVNK